MKFMRFIAWIAIISFGLKALSALLYLGQRLVSNHSFDKSDVAAAVFGAVAAWICRVVYKTLIKPRPTPASRATDLALRWPRFLFVAAILAIFPVLLVASSISDRNNWPATAAVSIMFLSMVVFLALGWARLRRANASQSIAASDTHQILKHLIGPTVPAVVWFVATIAATLAIALIGALHAGAA